MRCSIVLIAWVAMVACDEPITADSGPPDGGSTPFDAGPPPPQWPGTLAPSDTLGTRRGRSIARTVIHAHSPLSHDACDGSGWADGALNDPQCLANFRNAMCALRLDAMMMTDHAPHLDAIDFADAFWMRPEDEAVMDATGTDVIAVRMACDDGHRVLLTVGSENYLMPVMLERHPGTPAERSAVYEGSDAASIAALRAAGGLIFMAHTEGKTVDELRPLGLDGTEIYNLHANVAPDIREEELGLDPVGFLGSLLDFTRPALRLPPDLAVLSFIEVNQPSLDRWDTLLAEGQHIAGTGGCDSHENVFPQLLADGERADSHRRMMYWIQNHLLVDDVTDRAAIRDALATSRFYVTSEVFGSPVDFDFRAEETTATPAATFEMGETAPIGSTIITVRPRLPDGYPSDPAPTISMRILRAAADGGVEVASGTDATLEYVADVAGAYRVEVRMIPEHTRPFLGSRADRLIRELIWVYSNPIWIE